MPTHYPHLIPSNSSMGAVSTVDVLASGQVKFTSNGSEMQTRDSVWEALGSGHSGRTWWGQERGSRAGPLSCPFQLTLRKTFFPGKNHPEDALRCRLPGPALRASDSFHRVGALRICTSNMFPGAAAGLGPHSRGGCWRSLATTRVGCEIRIGVLCVCSAPGPNRGVTGCAQS